MTIPAGVSTIPEDCFRGCTALADIDLPGTVTSVGHNAFTGCTALKDVRCYGAAPAVEPGNSEAHSFEPATVTVHYNPAMNWTLDADGKWQGYTVSDKGASTPSAPTAVRSSRPESSRPPARTTGTTAL